MSIRRFDCSYHSADLSLHRNSADSSYAMHTSSLTLPVQQDTIDFQCGIPAATRAQTCHYKIQVLRLELLAKRSRCSSVIIFPTGPTCAYLPSAVVNVNLAPWRRTLISATPLQHMHRNTAEADSLRILYLRACQTRKLAIHEVHKLTSNYRMSAHRQSIRPPPFCSSMARADYPRVPKTRSHMPASAMQGRPHALPSKSSDFAQFH